MVLKNTFNSTEQKTRSRKRRLKIPLASIGIFYLDVTSTEDAKGLADAVRNEKVILCNLAKMQRWKERDAVLFIKRMQSISGEYAYT
ncbi:MAG: hypothetical protein ACFFBD_20120, partial [Candidatus Hodarchaeota archaeon]